MQHHDLLHEFPEFKEKIHELKISDAHFRRLFDEYHEVDKEVSRIESDIEPRAAFALEDLKKKRLLIKDQLFAILKK